jgi:hypothetical protein
MREGRKRVLWICATILAARKLAQYDRPCPGIEAAIEDAVIMAERIIKRIDSRYAMPDQTPSAKRANGYGGEDGGKPSC